MQLSNSESIWLSALLSALILVLGWMGLIRNKISELHRLTTTSSDISRSTDKLANEEMRLNQEVAKYRVLGEKTQKRIAYAFEDQNLEERMKGFIKELSNLSNKTGNQLVAIRPYTNDEDRRSMTSIRRQQSSEETEDYETASPGALKHFSVVKESGIPLYSTEIELRIRGSYTQVKRFIEDLSSIKSEMVKIESLYLSYEALDNRTLQKSGRGSNGYHQSSYSDVTHPMMMTSRLKFYLMEPGALSLTDMTQKPKKKAKSTQTAPPSKKKR
jgi:Tfp pilus assembly protein PilO